MPKTARKDALLAQKLSTLPEQDAHFVRRVFARHRWVYPHEVKDWLTERVWIFLRIAQEPQTSLAASKEELEEAREAYRRLHRASFEPESFMHRALNAECIRQLTWSYGSLEGLKKALADPVRGCNQLTAYAGWVLGLIPAERMEHMSPKLHKGMWPRRKWGKKRGR